MRATAAHAYAAAVSRTLRALSLLSQHHGHPDGAFGADEFLAELRGQYEVILLSDTFREFASPLMRKLSHPTLFCHELQVASNDRIESVRLRLSDHKRKTVQYLQKLNFEVVASGDSYNDLGMLKAADRCILFDPPASLLAEYSDMAVARDYGQLLSFITTPSS